ncbi:MAG: 4Fe-4S binding protein, partial [Clostridiales bacterium]|nr:4Fe-4S binding protein [Clostridiales bacterium]
MIQHHSYKQKETCSGCMACAQECPTSCIDHIIDDEGFMYPKVDLSMCIDCDHCVKICPFTHPAEHKITPLTCYAA